MSDETQSTITATATHTEAESPATEATGTPHPPAVAAAHAAEAPAHAPETPAHAAEAQAHAPEVHTADAHTADAHTGEAHSDEVHAAEAHTDEAHADKPVIGDRRPVVGDASTMGTFDAEGVYTPRQVTVDDLGGLSFADAIESTIVEFEDGDIVTGTVVKVDRDEVLLDIGFKSEGVIPARELSIRHDIDPSEVVSLGEKVEALVLQKEDKEGRLILSKKRAQYERAWGQIEKIKDSGGVVKGLVIEVVKGGLIIDIGLRGFLPASLVELRRVRDLQPYVGRILEAKIIELDKNRNNVVLSRRAYLEETQREQRGEFLVNLRPGEIRRGVVSSVVNFGAFVDLGGMDGLVHVSELSWKHVDHPASVVSVGDEITVQVLDVDLDKERISLSLKATQSDPWQEFAGAHRVGELVYGRITKLVPFGAFVQVGDGIEGLVHISEMASHHVDLPEQVVSPGEELWVKIIDIDLQRRRISLSIKQAAEGGEVAEEYREAFGEHAYDDQGNYIGYDYNSIEFTPETEAQAAWAEEFGVLPASDGGEHAEGGEHGGHEAHNGEAHHAPAHHGEAHHGEAHHAPAHQGEADHGEAHHAPAHHGEAHQGEAHHAAAAEQDAPAAAHHGAHEAHPAE